MWKALMSNNYNNNDNMHNPESVLEKETHAVFLDFEVQADHLIWDRQPDLVIVNKKKQQQKTKKKQKKQNKTKNKKTTTTCWKMDFARSGWPHSKTEGKQKER